MHQSERAFLFHPCERHGLANLLFCTIQYIFLNTSGLHRHEVRGQVIEKKKYADNHLLIDIHVFLSSTNNPDVINDMKIPPGLSPFSAFFPVRYFLNALYHQPANEPQIESLLRV